MSVTFDLAEMCEAAVFDPGLWNEALTVACHDADATSVGILRSEADATRFVGCAAETDAQVRKAYEEHFHKIDPIPTVVAALPVGRTQSLARLVETKRPGAAEFFADWALPNAMGHAVFSPLYRDATGTTWLCAAFSMDTSAQRMRQCEEAFVPLYRQIAPYARMACRAAALSEQLALIIAAWDAFPFASLIVAADGKVVAANAAAAGLQIDRAGIGIRGGRLRCRSADMASRLAARVAAVIGRRVDGDDGVLVILRDGRAPILVEVIANPVAGARTALVCIREARDLGDGAHGHAAAAYGLTSAETRVAELVASGMGVPAVAARLSLSRATVRIHLQRIFEKTGVHSQSALAIRFTAMGSLF